MTERCGVSYRTIVADPPWEMARGSDYRWRKGRPSGDRRQLDYGTMTTEEIASLPVNDWADPDAHLFVWTTHRHLEATFGIVRTWGFEYVCTLTWCKHPHGWGPGGVFQSTTEFVLYARRGISGVKGRVDRQWWTWPRSEHSAKPDAFLDMVEQAFPGPYLELFARRARFGWDYWGDESLGTAELDVERGGPGTGLSHPLARGVSVPAGRPLGFHEGPGVAARLAERPEDEAA